MWSFFSNHLASVSLGTYSLTCEVPQSHGGTLAPIDKITQVQKCSYGADVVARGLLLLPTIRISMYSTSHAHTHAISLHLFRTTLTSSAVVLNRKSLRHSMFTRFAS